MGNGDTGRERPGIAPWPLAWAFSDGASEPLPERPAGPAAEASARNARIEAERLGLKPIEQGRQQEQIAELDAQIATLEQRIAHLTLPAPADGIVLAEGLERLPAKVPQEGETLLQVSADNTVARGAPGGRTRRLAHPRGRRGTGRVAVPRPGEPPEIRGTVLAVGAEPSAGSPSQGGNRTFPVRVRLNRQDLGAVGLERLRRGYTADAKIVTRSERMVVLIWEYLLRHTEQIRDKTRQRVEEKNAAPTAAPPGSPAAR